MQAAWTAQASTIAVVGTGLDRVYPKHNRELAHRIASEGLIVSEFPLGTSPRSENFPIRNRIIAGMTRGTLVVEAALQSGSLITARLATGGWARRVRHPGSIHSPQARGCHALIKQGAKLVDRAEDVLEELRVALGRRRAQRQLAVEASAGATSEREMPVLDGARLRSGHAGCAGRANRLAAGRAARAHLLDLELDGRVVRLPGQLFQRLAHG